MDSSFCEAQEHSLFQRNSLNYNLPKLKCGLPSALGTVYALVVNKFKTTNSDWNIKTKIERTIMFTGNLWPLPATIECRRFHSRHRARIEHAWNRKYEAYSWRAQIRLAQQRSAKRVRCPASAARRTWKHTKKSRSSNKLLQVYHFFLPIFDTCRFILQTTLTHIPKICSRSHPSYLL